MTFWHWLVLVIAFAAPFFLIYLAVRAGVRAGLRDNKPSDPDGGN